MVAEKPNHNERLIRPHANRTAGRDCNAWHYEDEAALRWRNVLLRLSDNLLCAGRLRPDLAPILFDALDHAIETLLLQGSEEQLLRLEQWISEAETQLFDTVPVMDVDTRIPVAA